MQHKKVIEDMNLEITKIEQLFQQFKPLLAKINKQAPDFIELNALALLLHSFYNGLENIFKRIARKIDEKIPSGEKYHLDLLEQMATTTENRNHEVLTKDTCKELRKYLGFRHFLRYAYAFELRWDLMKELFLTIKEVKEQVLVQIKSFIEKLK